MENEEYDSIVSKDLPKDLIDFADKLKEWAVQTPLTKSGVEQTNERESFYTSKL